MIKKLLLIVFVLLMAFPVLYGLLAPEPNLDVFAINFSGLIFAGGMAKITGVFTGMKGKLGNTVLQMWKGIQVIRTHVIPANPQSAGQTTNRTLLTELVNMFKSIVIPFVHVYWNPFTTSKQTGWGNLIGLNQGLQQGSVIDFELVRISHGSLPKEDILTCTYTTATGVVDITWVDSGAEGSAGTDKAMLGVYNKDDDRWFFSDTEATRAEAADDVTLASGLTLTDLTAYLFFFTEHAVSGVVESISDSDAKETVAP